MQSSGQPEAKLVNEPKVEDKKAKATETTKEAGEAIKADSQGNFVKVANLDSKTKSWLSTYWNI